MVIDLKSTCKHPHRCEKLMHKSTLREKYNFESHTVLTFISKMASKMHLKYLIVPTCYSSENSLLIGTSELSHLKAYHQILMNFLQINDSMPVIKHREKIIRFSIMFVLFFMQ